MYGIHIRTTHQQRTNNNYDDDQHNDNERERANLRPTYTAKNKLGGAYILCISQTQHQKNGYIYATLLSIRTCTIYIKLAERNKTVINRKDGSE